MRILHTSDWHLGQSFFGKNRLPEHKAFFHWLIEQIKHYQIDALIVAGDIFDTSSPPSYARTLYNQFVVQLQSCQCQLFILGGNHDSVAMLNESRELLACLGTHVIPSVRENISDHIFMIHDKNGQPAAVLGAVPYLRSRDLITSEAGQDSQQKQLKLAEAITAFYKQVFEAAQKMADQASEVKSPLPIILTGHLTAMGVSASSSERDIYVGNLAAFNAHDFPPADYIALGHIHRPQKVAKSEHIRYSGSPLYLSFDELGCQKNVLMLEFESNPDCEKSLEINELLVPVFQQMQVIKGDLTQIAEQIQSVDEPDTGTVWLSVQVQRQEYRSDLPTQIQAMVEGKPFEIVYLGKERQSTAVMTSQAEETLDELSVEDVFQLRLKQEIFDTEDEQQQAARLTMMYCQLVAEMQEAEKA